MVDDVAMDDLSSSSFEAHGLPVPSSDTIRFTGNGSITPVSSEFSQTLPGMFYSTLVDDPSLTV